MKDLSSFLLLLLISFNLIAQEKEEIGEASFYASRFEGRLTASGELFSNDSLTAAHPSLPFGTKIKLTNLENKQQVIVRINDRGPYVKGRIVDVSQLAARKLGFYQKGLCKVKLEVIR